MEQEKKVTVAVTRPTYVADDGSKHPYTSFRLDIGGESFFLSPKPADKKALNILLRQAGVISDK